VHVTVLGRRIEIGFTHGVDAVFSSAPGHGHVQSGTVDAGVDDGVGGVHGRALGAVDGGRVSEVDVGGCVVGRDEHVVAGVLVADGQGAVFGQSGDGEQLAVDDSSEVGAVSGEQLLVLAGDHGVANTDRVPAG